MSRLVDQVSNYLRQGMGRDLDKRLSRLEEAQVGVGTITRLEKIITKWQLVEFRTTLEMIVSRLEASSFEIAVFGRVSSGKSSLLNHIAGIDALPVGVTPVTAVPTRLVSGDVPSVIVSLAETRPMSVELELLWEYASEEGNPGNNKHVTSILVKLPSPRLKEGIVFVDTPGVGSLALAGGAETEDRRALVERVPGLIADAVVSSQEHASESDIGGVIEEALFGRGREAHDIIAGFQDALSRSLDMLSTVAPLAHADPSSIRSFHTGGLPAVNLARAREDKPILQPWWAGIAPPLAVWATERVIRERFGGIIKETVEFYDRQLESWVKAKTARLVELYEMQAGTFREQIRRLANEATDLGTAGGEGALESDLKDLRPLATDPSR